MNDPISYFKVLYDYEHSGVATTDKYLSIRAGDIIEVEHVNNQHLLTTDWMFGRIKDTNEEGLFPAKYVESYEEKQTSLPRPLPRQRLKKHHFQTVYFRMPIICSHCTDYIWGAGKVGVKCSNCGLFFHNSCQHASSTSCSRKEVQNENGTEVYEELQLVEDWDIYEVKKWMAVVNLHRYSEIFANHGIDGSELLKLDENRIIGMNIKDNFHVSAILASINSLKKIPEVEEMPKSPKDYFKHCWSVYTFTSIQSCHVCGEFLFGIVQQGFQCQACGLCCHRKCSCSSLQPCDVDAMKGLRRPSFNSDSMFGRQLTDFSDVPLVLIHCASYLESRGCDLLNYYRKTPATIEVNLLKNMFDKNVLCLPSLNLSSYDCHVVGGVLKKFLRDLPDPVIPEKFYASFIQLDDGNRNALIDSLPRIHKITLTFLISHLRKDKGENLNKLARIFNQILMRPPWTRIMDIIDNTKVQTKCIELLLKIQGDDLTTASQVGALPNGNNIKSAPWYWENISREEVNDKMLNAPDGTYLVRDSTNKEENAPYTLTLRKNCKNMLIKIYYCYGKYGLMENLLFNSVEELIHYYSRNSLIDFNSNLDLKLQFPILKPIEKTSEVLDIVKLRSEFKELCRKHGELDEELVILHGEEEALIEECRMKQAAISAYVQVISMYKEHADSAKKLKATGDLMRISEGDYEVILKKLANLNDIIGAIEHGLCSVEKHLEEVVMRLEEKKADMIKCTQDKDRKEQLLEKCGETPENIALIKEGREVVSKETVPHLKESLWLLKDCNRGRAENLLSNRPIGTFLIRQREGDSYALSIVSPDKERRNQSVVHCLIDRKETGYGFAEPFYIHKQLVDLVLHYKETSLIEHNDILNVTLKYPVFCKDQI